MVISENEFVKILEFTKKQRDLEDNFVKALESLSPGTYCDCYLFDAYETELFKLLEAMFDDKYGDISYFIYDMDYGQNKRMPVYVNSDKPLYTNASELYRYLLSNKNNDENNK